jgi:hypothetical protein
MALLVFDMQVGLTDTADISRFSRERARASG